MLSWLLGFLLKVVLLAPPILMALTVHEASHGLVAYLRGDDTAYRRGRVSLNPFRHLDPAGTLVFFLTAWFGAGIGWAKPVPVDPWRLKDPRRDMIWVSAAGPASNLAFAAVLALALNGLIATGLFAAYADWKLYLGRLLELGVQINVVLAFFNLIPLPPLDGSGILAGLMPPPLAQRYLAWRRYGFAILLALIFLPGWLPGFPDLIHWLVLYPASHIVAWLLPWTG
jgi:Zn-dependent protease